MTVVQQTIDSFNMRNVYLGRSASFIGVINATVKKELIMKYKKLRHKSKKKKPWLPRPRYLIPASRVIKSKKDYNRQKEKAVQRFLAEY